MISFIKWYFPIKLLLTLLFLFTHAYDYGTLTFFLILLLDSIVIPIVVIIINLVKKRKLRSGEYVVKPEGKRL